MNSGLFSEVEFSVSHPDAKEPSKTYESDAGADLSCLEDFWLFPGETKLIKTGISLSVPNHCYAQLATRSSTALKSVCVTGGVIDYGYAGEVGVVLNNLGNKRVDFTKGDRIAQVIFLPIVEVTFKRVNELKSSPRGKKGFGSSNTK